MFIDYTTPKMRNGTRNRGLKGFFVGGRKHRRDRARTAAADELIQQLSRRLCAGAYSPTGQVQSGVLCESDSVLRARPHRKHV